MRRRAGGYRPAVHELFALLASLLDESKRSLRRHAIALLDIDCLTVLNEAYGPERANAVVAAVASRLGESIEPPERAAWWAGDQYLLLLPGANRRTALERSRQIVADLAREGTLDRYGVTVSAGVAICPSDGVAAVALVEAARRGLCEAKRNGGALVCSAKPGDVPFLEVLDPAAVSRRATW